MSYEERIESHFLKKKCKWNIFFCWVIIEVLGFVKFPK